MSRDEDKPYIENYPPLHAWLRRHGAHCNWQVPIGNARRPTAYVESWIFRGGREVIVLVRARKLGWDLYVSERGVGVEETLRAVEARIGLGEEVAGADRGGLAVALVQAIKKEIDEVREILRAEEGESLVDAARRVVVQPNPRA